MTDITRGDPANLKNVRRQIYHHYIRVDNPKICFPPREKILEHASSLGPDVADRGPAVSSSTEARPKVAEEVRTSR